jgi:hypothetical protein
MWIWIRMCVDPDPDAHGSALILVGWIQIHQCKKTTKIEKSESISYFEMLDVLF